MPLPLCSPTLDDGSLRYNCSLSTATSAYSTDTYLTGSEISVPLLLTGGIYTCMFDMTKTAAGTAAPVITVRTGPNASITDTARITFTFSAGTAVADTGLFIVTLNVNSALNNKFLSGSATCIHNVSGGGLTTTSVVSTRSSNFIPNSNDFLGLSFNGGASFSGSNFVIQSCYRQPGG